MPAGRLDFFKGKAVEAAVCTYSTIICKLLNSSFSGNSLRKAKVDKSRQKHTRQEATR